MDEEPRFDAWWERQFPGAAPTGLAFQDALAARWLRIHSLPGSKRYATSEAERIELLRRHREVATTVLGAASACALVIGGFAEVPGPADPAALALLPELRFAPVLAEHPEWMRHSRAEPDRLAASVAQVAWSFERFAELVLAVAADRISFVSFVSYDTAQIYAPYDGGADLIFATPARRDHWAAVWKSWRSQHPEGL